jgi:hypothetical protein
MNDGNVVTARALLTSRRGSPKVAGHIVDVKEIKDHRGYRTFPDILFWISMAMLWGAGSTDYRTYLCVSFLSPYPRKSGLAFRSMVCLRADVRRVDPNVSDNVPDVPLYR